ncbi:MAG: class I SAM-dependent methyltransferase [Eubacteriales bacterium]|nr:class I SAM-dependent methyltransferase [Eubacteriales bacterium]
MKLSKRLRCVADAVGRVKSITDIGCDHAYLPLYFVTAGGADFAVAADIRPGPLAAAREHVRAYGVSDRIDIRQSDGLSNIRAGETEALTICGMGGLLILKILARDREKLDAFARIVIEPQSDVAALAEGLSALGLAIMAEDLTTERGKFYPIFTLAPGDGRTNGDWDMRLARTGHPVMRRMIERRLRQLEKIEAHLRTEGIDRPGALADERARLRRLSAVMKRGDIVDGK